jgi:hypothetical protein
LQSVHIHSYHNPKCLTMAPLLNPSRTVTPLTIRHEIVLEFFYSVWGEDAKGKKMAPGHPGELRKATLRRQAVILPVSILR